MTREPCTSADGTPKRSYRSLRTAERQARLTRSAGPDREWIHAYLCPDSARPAHFHVGHATDEKNAPGLKP